MRKGIKIKASVLLMSWLMIFAHGIIPHNHFEDIPFQHELHNKGCFEESSNVLIKTHAEDKDGCRISNIIFHKFSHDEQNYSVIQEPVSGILITSQSVITSSFNDFISGRFSDTASLRGPPQA